MVCSGVQFWAIVSGSAATLAAIGFTVCRQRNSRVRMMSSESSTALIPKATKRRRRQPVPWRSIEMTLFSDRQSQCSVDEHQASGGEVCLRRNCHFDNQECLAKLLRSAKRLIRVAMYTFNVNSMFEAIIDAKRRNGIEVEVIIDNKMGKTHGSVFLNLIEEDCVVQWPHKVECTANLMHHKFILIDPLDEDEIPSGDSFSGEDYDDSDGGDWCKKCEATESRATNGECGADDGPKNCCECGSRCRIHSSAELLRNGRDNIKHLPKHGVLITGSLNWTMQAFRENFENVLITSNPNHIRDYNREFVHIQRNLLGKPPPLSPTD